MSNDYLKVGKLYSLTSTVDVAITGASFIHGISNTHNNSIDILIDGIRISLSVGQNISFSVPIAFSKVKLGTAGSSTIIYS